LTPSSREEWPQIILDLVRDTVVSVLGYDSRQEVDPHHAFTELGADSLAAVELSNLLERTTGLTLPTRSPSTTQRRRSCRVPARLHTGTDNQITIARAPAPAPMSRSRSWE